MVDRTLTGRVWKFGDNMNTDLMMPTITFAMPVEDQKKYVFESIRPGWHRLVKQGDMIIGGRNFGTGSSRPGARLLRELGIVAVVAESLNGLFLRNCVNYGVVGLACPGVSSLFAEGEEAVVEPYRCEIRNRARPGDGPLTGRALPPELIELALEGGVRPLLKKQGYLN